LTFESADSDVRREGGLGGGGGEFSKSQGWRKGANWRFGDKTLPIGQEVRRFAFDSIVTRKDFSKVRETRCH